MRALLATLLLLLASCATTSPGVLTACWPGGVADYGCRYGTPIIWSPDALPLRYSVALEPAQEHLTTAIHYAAVTWNSLVGREVLVHDEARATVVWRSGAVTPDGTAALVLHHGSQRGPSGAVVELRAAFGGFESVAVAIHEFGHVLGLTHYTHGVMATRVVNFDADPPPWGAMMPADAQVEVLRRLYR